MKPGFKMTILFLVGCVVGAISGGMFMAWRYYNVFKWQYSNQVLDQANVAREIYAGRSKKLADDIVKSLPNYVVTVDYMYGKDEKKFPILWLVQRVIKRIRSLFLSRSLEF